MALRPLRPGILAASIALAVAGPAMAQSPALTVAINEIAWMGRLADAQSAFEHALTLDPAAAYARENLCRVLAAQGEGCREAR